MSSEFVRVSVLAVLAKRQLRLSAQPTSPRRTPGQLISIAPCVLLVRGCEEQSSSGSSLMRIKLRVRYCADIYKVKLLPLTDKLCDRCHFWQVKRRCGFEIRVRVRQRRVAARRSIQIERVLATGCRPDVPLPVLLYHGFH